MRKRRRAPLAIREQRRKRDSGFGVGKVGRMVEGGVMVEGKEGQS